MSKFTTMLMLLLLFSFTAVKAQFSGGTGTELDPYQISNLTDLQTLSENNTYWAAGTYFIQTANIDASETSTWNAGAGFSPIGNITGAFSGSYDGNFKKIKNLSINQPDTDYCGLFGSASNALLQNIYLTNADIIGKGYLGILVGSAVNTNITACGSSGTVTGQAGYCGGLIGKFEGETAEVRQSFSDAIVSGASIVGGLTGQGGNYFNCYATGEVTADMSVGGLVGLFCNVTNCYATTFVNSDGGTRGGLVGWAGDGVVINSFWDTETSGQASSWGGTGKTTAEMQTLSTFTDAGWDFAGQGKPTSPVWDMKPYFSGGYPDLVVQQNTLFSGGTGTELDPYQIATLDDLRFLSENDAFWSAGNYFIQTADIDASETSTWNAGEGFSPIGNNANKFQAVYDGQNYSISNLYINSSSQEVGLFGNVNHGDAEIKNLKLIDVDVSSTSGTVGGLVGLYGWGKSIANCHVSGTVSGDNNVGLLVGDINSPVSGCSTSGEVTATGYGYAGGFSGATWDCPVINCYSTATVSGANRVGGFSGYVGGAEFTNCYSTGEVTGTNDVGGFVSNNLNSTATNCFWDTETSGQATSGLGTGKTTAEMTTLATFTDAGWDFVDETTNGTDDIWAITWQNNGYPIFASQAKDPFSGGDGSELNPFEIATLEDLRFLSENDAFWSAGNYFIQTADIDASETSTWNAGEGFSPIGSDAVKFNGTYDGQGYKIDGLFINRPSTQSVGLFGNVEFGNGINNLGLINVDITGEGYTGALIGSCFVPINKCYSTGTVTGTLNGVGGLIGYNRKAITNCYSKCDVTGNSIVGGLIGYHNYNNVNYCYSTGAVSGNSNVGGLIGYNYFGNIQNCFWDTETSGQATSDGGTGKTTVEMMQQATFTNWDFTNVWGIRENSTYPYLRPGTPGNMLNFDGSDDYVQITHGNNLTFTENTPFTIELYFQTTSSGWEALVNNLDVNTNWAGYELVLDDGAVFFYITDDYYNTGMSITTDNTFNDGLWHHVAVSYTGGSTADNMAIFVDGVPQSVTIGTNNLAATAENTEKVYLGAYSDGSYPFIGNMDEIRIWDYARTKCEIQQYMHTELVGDESGLVAYYTFNQGMAAADNTAETTLYDLTANGNDGTLTHFALNGTDGNFLSSDVDMSGVSVIVDNTVPVPDEANLPQIDAQCSLDVADLTAPTATDECEGVITATLTTPMPITEQGAATLTWKFDDGYGNVVTQEQDVMIEDTENPTPVAQDLTVYLDENGEAEIAASDYFFHGDKNGVLWLNGSPFYDTGDKVTFIEYVPENDSIYFSANDNDYLMRISANGGEPDVVLDVYANDFEIDYENGLIYYSESYMGIYKANLDGSGTPELLYDVAFYGLNGIALDKTANKLFFTFKEEFIIASINTDGSNYTELYTGADGVVEPRDIVVDPDNQKIIWAQNYEEEIMIGDYDGGTAPQQLYGVSGQVYGLDTNGEILYWGVKDSESAIYKGSLDGVATPELLLSGDFGGIRGIDIIDMIDVDNGSTDNCALANLELDQTLFTCDNVGDNTVTLTAYDHVGNQASTTATITVIPTETENPVITSTHDDTAIDADANCEALLPDYTDDITATDNCGAIASVEQSPLPDEIITGSTNLVTLTVFDYAGNEANVSFNVAVEDNETPTISCIENTSINLTEGQTNYTVQGAEFDPTQTNDNCEIASIENDYNNTSTLDAEEFVPGTYTITWTVTDVAGNSENCFFSLTVNDFVGIDLPDEIEVSVFPNPTNGKFTIQNAKGYEVIITDISGRTIYNSQIKTASKNIDLSLENGLFIVYLKSDTGVYTTKLIVE